MRSQIRGSSLRSWWTSRPAPDAGRLAAQVSAGSLATVSDVAAALAAARGHLRGELASALARKRTPELVFEVVP